MWITTILKKHEELQNTYDAFVKKYGRLNDKANDFTEDIDGHTLRSGEI